jgi:hypothetical protein
MLQQKEVKTINLVKSVDIYRFQLSIYHKNGSAKLYTLKNG